MQLVRYPIAAAFSNGLDVQNMEDQRVLQHKDQDLMRINRHLELELQKKEKAIAEAAALLLPAEMIDSLRPQEREPDGSKRVHWLMQVVADSGFLPAHPDV